MLSVTKEFTFDCAHYLEGHKGLCKNLHGHTYKLQVTAHSATLNEMGMLVDFSDLKALVNTVVVMQFDHAYVSPRTCLDDDDEYPMDAQLTSILEAHGSKVVYFGEMPTAEKMAISFYTELNKVLSHNNKDYRISEIKLWETPTSFATYTGGQINE